MRTIKFRGKWVSYGKWVYGNLLCSQDETTTAIQTSKFTYRVDPKTVGQFTGLHDVNGTEIYEGDVIESVNGFRSAIGYIEDCASFMAVHKDDEVAACPLPSRWIKDFGHHVIGNIHDNPELLSNSK
jgi:uncharacterized phage protein (TIGR01671 family)